ncbi:transglutaminase domain-containing protein [Bifidobacterium pullorum subsp. saeculare]|uniref:transglutaminase domain-containing protein n=1 Tax=Bifidobacterium pullorum TaxID=78448 RepID=UPI00195A089D|nr:transglutaminase domain-containing protein [Bifidobacterium pullorum]MBM6692819.1 transglutaminase domain-containing protein [Bifidobacterium pullorum subsp. saeculare]
MRENLLSPALHDYADNRYRDRKASLGGLTIPADTLIGRLDGDRRALMHLLVGTLPTTDILECEPATLLDYVDHALELRRSRAWTAALPEDVFIHYVFWPRVNNERLEPCRSRIAGELDARVTPLDMECAAIETNYWCAEHVTYAPSDIRTIGPVGALNRGTGRCGEESTLLVSALRAVGIPARQVYTPRWAHCDDNHAWVEAMVDGVWRFMGACEPEERLDRGWFDCAAARAMLIHARVFCDYTTGSVDVAPSAGRQDAAILQNLTASYAPTARLTVTVTDADGAPVPDADVRFELLNMAEFAPIAQLAADEDGRAAIELGLGTVLVHASTPDGFGEALVDTASTTAVTVTLDAERRDDDAWTPLSVSAPAAGGSRAAALTSEQKAVGADRARRAETMRVERLESFARQSATGDADTDEILRLAGGNWPVIARFLEAGAEPDRMLLLQALSDKDLADVHAETLDDALAAAAAIRDHAMRMLADLDEHTRTDLWRDAVLNPRVDGEELAGDRRALQQRFDADRIARFRSDPRTLWQEMLRDVRDAEDDEPYTGTVALLSRGYGDVPHRGIAFVTICRCLGIPARLNPETRSPQYFDGARFVDVQARGSDRLVTCMLTAPGRDDIPRYGVDWTIGRLQRTPYGMDFSTIDLGDVLWTDGAARVHLEPGTYRVITTTRLPNGGQLAASRTLRVADEDCAITLDWRQPAQSDLLAHLPLEDLPLIADDGADTPLSEVLHGRRGVVFILDAHGSEPSIHVLDELRESLAERPDSDTGTEPVIALCPHDAPVSAPITAMLARLPRRFRLWRCSEPTAARLARITFVDPDKSPVIVAIRPGQAQDDPLTGIYACSGYNVGSVELALRLNRV